jgi:ABC-2 type transport system permease protein
VAEPRAAGTIYDLGYRHYEGDRLGRANAVTTLAGYSFRSAFGLGRGERAKVVPVVILLLCFAPVFVQVSLAASTGRQQFINFSNHLQSTAFFVALLTAAQAPELIVADRQQGVLGLYMSRSLRSTDYALAKLAAFVGALLVYVMLPQLVLFAGRVLVSEAPWTALRDSWGLLGPVVGGTALVAVYMASVGLALASLTARRAHGSAAVIAFFLLLPAASGIIREILAGDAKRYALAVNPFVVTQGFANWLFDVQAKRRSLVRAADLPGETYLYVIAGTCVVAVAVLLLRFRRSDA